MQQRLFEFEIFIDDVINGDFLFFKNQEKLDLNSSNVVEKFLYDFDFSNPIYYHCSLDFNSLTKDFKYKYIIINYNNDKVFVMYKIVELMKTKKIKLIDKPFSLNKNIENEKKILDILLKKTFFMATFKEKYKKYYEKFDIVESIPDFDYYIDIEKGSEKINNKFKKNKLINRFEKNKDFKIEITNLQNDSYLELRKIWQEYKKDLTNPKNYQNFFDNYNSKKLYLNIYYKNMLIVNYAFLIENNYLINLFRSSMARKKDLETYLKSSLSYIDDVCYYFLIKEFKQTKYKRIYFAGAHPKNKSLIEFKEKHSDGKIKYYKTK